LPLNTYKCSLNTFSFPQETIFLLCVSIGNYNSGCSFWPTCFDKKSSFDTISLLCISILVQTLNFILCTFPLTPNTKYAQGKLCSPCIWKQWFISYVSSFLVVILFIFYLDWINNDIININFMTLIGITIEGKDMQAIQSKKKYVCLNFFDKFNVNMVK
jgi:hypothetical protein